MGAESHPLFETRTAKGRWAFKLYAGSVLVAVLSVWAYRVLHISKAEEDSSRWQRWVWMGLLAAELWFGLYWVLTLSVRWNPVYRLTHKDRLLQRHQSKLPRVDVFVCTADPKLEPPSLVISTVLSVMSYDHPPEKLAVYLSDDGGSELTFYALLEASRFAKDWVPFCKKFNVEPRSPAAYFSGPVGGASGSNEEWLAMKKLYEEMEKRIDAAVQLGKVPEEIGEQHKGFTEWNSGVTAGNHQSIVQILIDGRDPDALDVDGSVLPTLVYVSREKRPQHFHNFKAGAMNTLIRVSSEISNGQVILNVDCDMYSNNSQAIRDALCFFMDEEKGDEIAFVQSPQNFDNISKNDLYGGSLSTISNVDFHGLDTLGGPLYIGSGCFQRRWSLLGNPYTKAYKQAWEVETRRNEADSRSSLEERTKQLATCTFEQNTKWGKEVGLKYGCPVEDVITGLSIQCRGWKSIFYNPARKAFLGVAPVTLAQTLVQHKRWSEGDFQIFLSKYNPLLYGRGTLSAGLQMGYAIYCLWAPNSVPVLYYVVVPAICLFSGFTVFPNVSEIWFVPFAYLIVATTLQNLLESVNAGLTVKGWWNEYRIWLYKRTTSYLFATVDTVLKVLGLNSSAFIITAKVADADVTRRYESEVMEFGVESPMFTILSALAVLQLICLVGGAARAACGGAAVGDLFIQFLLCVALVAINLPLYNGMFVRKDAGRIPGSVAVKGVAVGVGACVASLALAMAGK